MNEAADGESNGLNLLVCIKLLMLIFSCTLSKHSMGLNWIPYLNELTKCNLHLVIVSYSSQTPSQSSL